VSADGPHGATRHPRWWAAGAGIALARRPRLWPTAFRVAVDLVPGAWWRRWPPLPLPASEWLGFRMETAYGAPERRPGAGEVVEFVLWCREMKRLR
jgi:hypothetical protein